MPQTVPASFERNYSGGILPPAGRTGCRGRSPAGSSPMTTKKMRKNRRRNRLKISKFVATVPRARNSQVCANSMAGKTTRHIGHAQRRRKAQRPQAGPYMSVGASCPTRVRRTIDRRRTIGPISDLRKRMEDGHIRTRRASEKNSCGFTDHCCDRFSLSLPSVNLADDCR
jgi:hypothetical protein